MASGVLLLVGGASVLLGARPRVGLAALVVFLAEVTPVMHGFWEVEDPQARMLEMNQFMKNLALLGAALALLSVPRPWPLSPGPRLRTKT